MEIKIIDKNNKWDYAPLLLLADEQKSMVEKYIDRGTMFALFNEDVKSVCIVTIESENTVELKNIATCPKYQSQGYATLLINHVSNYYKKNGYTSLYVGTGNTPKTINFYNKCGFIKSHIAKNFFIDNYDHDIYDNGIHLIDMIYLHKKL